MADPSAEEFRVFIRQQADANLYFFLKAVFGFNDLIPGLHGHFANYVSQDRRFKLIVGPRGHLKTSVCTIGYAAWRALRDSNLRILVTGNTATNASHMIRTIKGKIENSPLIQWLYPESIPAPGSTKWTESELEFKRSQSWPEATIESLGRGGTATSRHFDIIIEDDLLAPEENADVTLEMVQDAIGWHKYATGLRISKDSEQVISANRWLYDDYVAYLFENEKWFLPCLYFSAYDPEGQPRWPERFPADELDRILEQQGPRIFSCQYLNDPVHEDARSFDPSWLRYFTTFPPVDDLGRTKAFKCVTAIDPAISKKKHGDYSAIVTVATDDQRNRYVVDARRGRWGIDELIDHTFDVFRTWKPLKVGLETVMFQKALLYPFREAMRREGVNLPMVELRPNSKVTKEGRIQGLHEFFANGSLWLNKLHTDLLREVTGWPAVAHDDLVDALAYAMQMLVYPEKQQSYAYWDNASFEYITRELHRNRALGSSPFVYAGTESPAPAGWRRGLPQSREDVWKLIQESRRDS